MSAYMHDSAHIDALVHGAIRYSRHGMRWEIPGKGWVGEINRVTLEGATRIGRVLLRENAESMAYRYNMKDLDNDADDGTRPVEYLGYLTQADEYRYSHSDAGVTRNPWRYLPPVALLNALASYEYQACEHPEWKASEAHSFCESLRHALIGALPGYRDADTWAISGSVNA